MHQVDYEKLEKIAGEQGMTLGELAHRVRRSPSSIYKLKGCPVKRTKALGKIARALGVTVDDLIVRESGEAAAKSED